MNTFNIQGVKGKCVANFKKIHAEVEGVNTGR